MSLEVNKTINKISLKRDSFNDRICDNLCEVLLKYLSFEEKIKFECVSKQFRNSILKNQNLIEIDLWSDQRLYFSDILSPIEKCFVINGFQLNRQSIDVLLKKLKSINNIVIKSNDSFESLHNREVIILLIIKNCVNLNAIKFDFCYINDKILAQFGNKLGLSLRDIDFNIGFETSKWAQFKSLLKSCSELSSIKCLRIEHLIDSEEVLVPKLLRLETYFSLNDWPFLELFAKSYAKTLKSFIIDINEDMTEYAIEVLLNEISNLVKLEELKLSFNLLTIFGPNFVEKLKLIGNKCTLLKRFSFKAFMIQSLAIKVFETIRFFTQLKSLEMNFMNKKIFDNELSVETLPESKQLTHLKLMHLKINDNFFNDIDIYSPKLKHLEILIEDEITDRAMTSLSKLQHLESISIKGSTDYKYFLYITDKGISDLIKNSPKMRKIEFNRRPEITERLIEELIKLAKSKPKVEYNLMIPIVETISAPNSEYSDRITNLNIMPDKEVFPQNLRLITDNNF